jgi:hypothetical protein
MEMKGIEFAHSLLDQWAFIDPCWHGYAFIPFWGSVLEVGLRPEDEDLSARQISTLRAVLGYPRDLRPTFERALFEYYQSDVDGSYCEYDENGNPVPGSGPPKLNRPADVWPLIDEPVIYIHGFFRTPSSIEFELSLNCLWDPEHGLGVLYRDWEPVEFGGWNL